MDCPPGQKRVAVVERWPLLLWRLDCIDGDQNIGRDTRNSQHARNIYAVAWVLSYTSSLYVKKSSSELTKVYFIFAGGGYRKRFTTRKVLDDVDVQVLGYGTFVLYGYAAVHAHAVRRTGLVIPRIDHSR